MGLGEENDRVYCLDFGLAKLYRDRRTLRHLPRREGSLAGTPRCVSLSLSVLVVVWERYGCKLSVCLSLCVSVCLSVCLPVSLCVCLSVLLSAVLVCLCAVLSVLPTHLLSVMLSVCHAVFLFIWVSIVLADWPLFTAPSLQFLPHSPSPSDSWCVSYRNDPLRCEYCTRYCIKFLLSMLFSQSCPIWVL